MKKNFLEIWNLGFWGWQKNRNTSEENDWMNWLVRVVQQHLICLCLFIILFWLMLPNLSCPFYSTISFYYKNKKRNKFVLPTLVCGTRIPDIDLFLNNLRFGLWTHRYILVPQHLCNCFKKIYTSIFKRWMFYKIYIIIVP